MSQRRTSIEKIGAVPSAVPTKHMVLSSYRQRKERRKERTVRKEINLNKGWIFQKEKEAPLNVDLPHTWNNLDGQDGGNDYYRGTCRYEKSFPLPAFTSAERVYLEFRGVNASAQVELNGQEIGCHDGGYSTFRWDVTERLEQENRLTVRVDNSVNERVYPQKADFTFYGGIYRDVLLRVVPALHFDLDHLGSEGIRVTAKPVKDYREGQVQVETWLGGGKAPAPDQVPSGCRVEVTILDAEGKAVAAGEGRDVVLSLSAVKLWDGVESPYLYTARACLLEGEQEVDQVEVRFGVRDFHCDPKAGFFLNGRSYPLRGVSRHQDRKGIGNELTRQMHREDMDLICEMGANTIRLAHYQHDQYDERGMVVWAEIPYISEHMPQGRDNTISQMKELITQNYNHPSIVCWGVSNEITISTKDKKDMMDNHRVLNDLCHRLDQTRFTTLACYAMCGPFNPVAHITDVVSWNLYLGWYVPGMWLNDAWMRFFHTVYPKRCLGYSEYGAEGMPNLHAEKPRRGDHSEEYQALYHEFMLRCFERNPYLWATHVWNMFDFAADARDQGGEPGMNHKGLVTFDRKTKKDSFYLYKAWWSKEPFVHICSRRFENRTSDRISVKVYSNQKEVTLFCNGKPVETKQGDHVFVFQVPLGGEMTFRAESGSCQDTAVFRRAASPDPSYRLQKSGNKSANWV